MTPRDYLPAFTPARASWPLRFVAGLLDLLVAFFISLPLAPYVSHVALLAVYFVMRYGARYVLGATPAEWIIGLRAVDRSVYRSTTEGRHWLRALAGIAITLYVGLTVSAGFLISSLTDEKISPKVVAARPLDVARPHGVGHGDIHTFERLSVALPRDVGPWHGELTHCCVLYGGATSEDAVNPGVLVYASTDLHPYDYCGGIQGGAVRYLSGCGQTPVEYQHWISAVTPRDRWTVWNPVKAVRTNFALVAKSIYFEELDDAEPIRRFRSGDAEVVWLRGRRVIAKKNEKVSVALDRFLIASGTQHGSVDVVWKKTPRDESMLNELASSLTLSPLPAGSGTPLLERMNAWRRNTADASIAESLRLELARSGTDRERHSFATSVESRAKHAATLASVAGKTAGWR